MKSTVKFVIAFLLVFAAYLAIHQKWIINLIITQYDANQFYASATNALLIACTGIFFSLTVLTVRRWVIAVFLLLVLPALMSGFLYSRILGATMDFDAFNLLIHEAGKTQDFIKQYYRTVILAFGLVTIILTNTLIARFMAYKKRPYNDMISGLSIAGLIATPLLAFGSQYFPRYAPTYDSAPWIYSYHLMATPEPMINHNISATPDKSEISKIVLIIDESVTYDAFVNQIANNGFISVDYINYGNAISGGNCSASANALIRWAANPMEVIMNKDPRSYPTLWDYAKKADYETVLVDGQTSPGRMPGNFMHKGEQESIDIIHQIKGGIETDLQIAEKIHSVITQNKPSFVYAILRGAHFPYDGFPDSDNAGMTDLERYSASIAYSKRHFFETLLRNVDLHETLIIYTSDHGQNIVKGRAAHCNSLDYDAKEYSVPLLAITQNEHFLKALTELNSPGSSRVSHLQIAPTLLIAMGYDKTHVENAIFPSLLSKAEYTYLFQHAVFPSLRNTPPPYERVSLADGLITGKPRR